MRAWQLALWTLLWPRGKRPQSRTFPQGGAQWRHAEIADLIGSLKIKTSGGFLEKERDWICPGCGRSKAQIVAPGQNVDIVAMIHRHHDHIENLISDLLSEANGLRPVSASWR